MTISSIFQPKRANLNGFALFRLMKEALKKNLFFHIENPVEWQREMREERVLPGRNSASMIPSE